MRCSIEPRDRRYVNGNGFLSFAKDIGKNIYKKLSSKNSQKLLDSATITTKDPVKVASKRAIQKTAEATGDLIDNKIADKIAKVSKVHSKDANNEIPKERYISSEESQQIIDELRLT